MEKFRYKRQTVTKYKNPAETHKYSYSNLVMEIERRLEKQNIKFEFQSGQQTKHVFTSYVLTLFINFYDMKSNEKYAFKHIIGKSKNHSYSQSAAEFVVSEIKKDPQHIIANLKKAKTKR
nr:hypothetical protein [Leuconostoc gelidum]